MDIKNVMGTISHLLGLLLQVCHHGLQLLLAWNTLRC